MCIKHKTGERLSEPRLYPSCYPHTYNLYISRQGTNIVYILVADI
jgi:hypothetical protein